jgi:hypothetical protein
VSGLSTPSASLAYPNEPRSLMAILASLDRASRSVLGDEARDRGEDPVVKIVLTPGGRFPSVASAARHHKVSATAVRQHIRDGRPGWQFEAPYQIPAGFVPLARTPWCNRGPGKS